MPARSVEACDRTTWTRPDQDYEAAVHATVDAAFDDPETRRLVAEAAGEVAAAGGSNWLSIIDLTTDGLRFSNASWLRRTKSTTG